MSKGWKRTDLIMGEDLMLSPDFFETGDNVYRNHRIEYQRYVGETETGIIVEVQFKPGWSSEDPIESWRVQKFINFASIYCGDAKVYRQDRTLVRAERKVVTGFEK